MNVLLSIKPEFAEKILRGSKKYEFRKTTFSHPEAVETVYLYSSSPVQRVVGAFTMAEVSEGSPRQLWEQFGHQSGMDDRDRFMAYFEDTEEGYAIGIDQVLELDEAIDPRERIDDFVPPVSFHYLDDDSELNVLNGSGAASPGNSSPTKLEQYSSD
ncbi:hypothetical protein HZS55_22040 [Halosimplex rubrum]|uniref:ASCH domain-containing protein n=1 Tax=Halosimplex rubrum TaxID=869889 RepID=A0A7D5T8E5_9EURY|nr:hypothetical protein [Halosimplex rubrum]QLH79809.1 hypothetical protein HZS55_22040 [Halosimplex rubrum]